MATTMSAPSAALRAQVASKWQEAFTRLNRDQPGISGLMEYSEVRLFAWARRRMEVE